MKRTNELRKIGTSLVVQWLRIHLPMHGVCVQSLVRELSSHMPCYQKIKQTQYCNKFNKDLKKDPHQKIYFFKKRNTLIQFTLHVTFLRDLLENVLHQNNGK